MKLVVALRSAAGWLRKSDLSGQNLWRSCRRPKGIIQRNMCVVNFWLFGLHWPRTSYSGS